jgi:hypothetical protein
MIVDYNKAVRPKLGYRSLLLYFSDLFTPNK